MDTTTYPFRVTAETIGSRPRAKRQPKRAPRRSSATKTINLALQGGGAHGAFTWTAPLPAEIGGKADLWVRASWIPHPRGPSLSISYPHGHVVDDNLRPEVPQTMHEPRNLGVAR
jgi:hypothetical protein